MGAAMRWKITSNHRLANLLSIIGGIGYMIQSGLYAHTQASLLDEGAYLYKGYLFAIGKYWPYQDFGPWTNHMPLSFLIPGHIQALFEPGLRTGRYLAVFFSVLTIIGLWVIVRRLGGEWWAALAVWAFALNPAIIKLYSLANTQSLIACMLVWILVLTLGGERPLWQVLIGAGMAGVMLVTRVNLFPVLLLLLLYIYWEYGWRSGIYATVAGIFPVLIVHLIYWPGIMKVWAHWIPQEITPFLDSWRYPAEALPSWNPAPNFTARLMSFFQGFRFHFVAMIGVVSVLLLWPGKQKWSSRSQFKVVIFLTSLFGFLIILHMWAALGKSYCVYCYPVYLSFFVLLGLILIIVSFNSWENEIPLWRQILIGSLILVISAGIGFSASQDIGGWFLPLLGIKVPRFRAFRILPGNIEFGGLIQNYFGWDAVFYEQFMRSLLPTLAGLLFGLIVIIIAISITKRLNHRSQTPKISGGYIALILLLVIGYMFTPTLILGGGYSTYDCGGDVIGGYELAGEHLATNIPQGSLVYWEGGNSVVPLLYLENVEIFPAQINGDYAYRLGGTPDELERFGFWSADLAIQWADIADYILIEERSYNGWLRDLVESGKYDELEPSASILACRKNSAIHIFEKSGDSQKE